MCIILYLFANIQYYVLCYIVLSDIEYVLSAVQLFDIIFMGCCLMHEQLIYANIIIIEVLHMI